MSAEMEIQGDADDSTDVDSTDNPAPLLRVVRGEPTDEELAALVAVVAALGASGAPTGRDRSPSGWVDRSALLRRPPPPGVGAWVRSGRPA